jgi:hypothetical protein
MKRIFVIVAVYIALTKPAAAIVLNVFTGSGKNSREESDHQLQKALEQSSEFILSSDAREEASEPLPEISKFEFWKHVGKVGMGSGVYLGNGYVLTSAHVGCYPLQIFDGSYYRPDYKSWKVLELENGTQSDLAIFRVEAPDGESELAKLAPIEIADQSPQAADAVLMMGTGLQQQSAPAAMSSNGRILAVLGYHIDRRRATRGGLNRIEEVRTLPIKTGDRETYCFTTKFDRGIFEAQASDGDSGGATFAYDSNAERWRLAGCIIAVSQKDGFVPFGSQTFLADLSRYRNQISRILAGAPHLHQPGDLVLASASVGDAKGGEEAQMVKIPSAPVGTDVAAVEPTEMETCPM